MNLDESQPDFTLTIPEALDQTMLKGNESGISEKVLTVYIEEGTTQGRNFVGLKSLMSHFHTMH